MLGNPKNRIIAILTARGGSKRLPRKNVRDFRGQPIIQYPIEACLESGIYDEVMVSTDDPEIARISLAAGAKVPFMRSAATSSDTALPWEVFEEVLGKYQSELGREFTHFSCIYPTAAFITPEMLREALRALEEQDADSILTVTRYGPPIQRALKIDGGFLGMFEPKYMTTRSQDLAPAYHDCAQFFICKTSSFLSKRLVMTDRTLPFVIPEAHSQDIDSEEDWQLAEMKFDAIRGKK